jgi:hypothetical protein
MSRRTLAASASLVTLFLVAPAAPVAAQDGIFVDPGSPPAKEYAVPLEAARREGAAGTTGAPGEVASTPAPAFGVGVGGSPAKTSGGVNAGISSSDGSSERDGSTQDGIAGSPAAVPLAERVAVHDGGSGPVLLSVGVAAALVALGVGGAMTLRRSAGRS